MKWSMSFKTGETKLRFLNQASLIHNVAWKPLKSIHVHRKSSWWHLRVQAYQTWLIHLQRQKGHAHTGFKVSWPMWVWTKLLNIKASEYRHKKIKVTSDFQWKLEAKLWSEEWSMFKLDAVPLESVTLRFTKELSHRLEKLIRANLIQGRRMPNSILRPPLPW